MGFSKDCLMADYISDSFDQALTAEIWGQPWGVSNSAGQIKKILVHRPGQEILQLQGCVFEEEAGALILRDKHGRIRSYCKACQPPDLRLMQKQHDLLTDALRKCGAEVLELDDLPDTSMLWTNRIFVRDAALITPAGAILSRFSMFFRQGETPKIQRKLSKIGMPIVGVVQCRGCVEGGSFAMLDKKTAVLGCSERVNREGAAQVRDILTRQGIELICVDLPSNTIHLDSVFLQLDYDKALVDVASLPYWFLEFIKSRKIEIIPLDPDDPPLTNNCIAVSPGKVIFPSAGEKTMARLCKSGIEVIPVDVTEINKMGGGIHCATLELIRDDM